MKKYLCALLLVIISAVLLTGCDLQTFFSAVNSNKAPASTENTSADTTARPANEPPSMVGMIDESRALEVVYTDADVAGSQVSDTVVTLRDTDDGPVYDISFSDSQADHTYTVDACNATILHAEHKNHGGEHGKGHSEHHGEGHR